MYKYLDTLYLTENFKRYHAFMKLDICCNTSECAKLTFS